MGVIEDLTSSVDFVIFYKNLVEYGSFLQTGKKVILSGRVQKREEQDSIQFIIESVKPVENSNLVHLSIKKEMPFEEIIELKDFISQFKGSDPLIIHINSGEATDKKTILTGCNFWVESSNVFINSFEKKYNDKIDIKITSLDS